MMTYNDVLAEIQRFSLTEQLRLLKDLKQLVNDAVNDDEDIPSELLEESASAWQDYLSEKDPGISSQELKRKLLGDNLC
ncbi:MAG TPA: hypothetical protein DD000_26665 [Cyanobacteria bacterium UBA11166]|nr:hypothetical protein [Cyanobacteria bacterium UBA11166]